MQPWTDAALSMGAMCYQGRFLAPVAPPYGDCVYRHASSLTLLIRSRALLNNSSATRLTRIRQPPYRGISSNTVLKNHVHSLKTPRLFACAPLVMCKSVEVGVLVYKRKTVSISAGEESSKKLSESTHLLNFPLIVCFIAT